MSEDFMSWWHELAYSSLYALYVCLYVWESVSQTETERQKKENYNEVIETHIYILPIVYSAKCKAKAKTELSRGAWNLTEKTNK